MVLHQGAQGLAQLGMGRGDRGEQETVLADVVIGQGRAEAVAVQQKISGGPFRGHTATERGACHAQGFSQPLVDGAQFSAPGGQPGVLALSHERAKGATSSSSSSFEVRRLHV